MNGNKFDIGLDESSDSCHCSGEGISKKEKWINRPWWIIYMQAKDIGIITADSTKRDFLLTALRSHGP